MKDLKEYKEYWNNGELWKKYYTLNGKNITKEYYLMNKIKKVISSS